MTDTPDCCDGCHNWHQHNKSCWYYWELKKHCTMWTPKIEVQKLQ